MGKRSLYFLAGVFLGFFSLSVSQASVDSEVFMTERLYEVSLQKTGETYAVEKVSVQLQPIQGWRHFALFKGTVPNGTVLSEKGEILVYFPIPSLDVVYCYDNFSGEHMTGGCEVQENGNIALRAPYFANGHTMILYSKEGEKVLTIDVSAKKVCNENAVCEAPREDGVNCPSDCDVQKNPVVTEKPTPPAESVSQKNNIFWIIFGGGFGVLVLAVAVVLFIRRRNSL